MIGFPTEEEEVAQRLKAQKGKYPRRPDHVVWKVIEEKGILLNLENGAYFEIDPVGLAIWQGCDGKTSEEKIAEVVSQEFKTDPKKVIRDLAVFVTELKRKKLLKVSEEPLVAASCA